MYEHLSRSPFSFNFDEKNKENFYYQQSFTKPQQCFLSENTICLLPELNQNVNYELEYRHLYLANIALISQIKDIKEDNNQLESKVLSYWMPNNEDKQDTTNSSKDNKKKRTRRAAEKIDRHYKCPLETCEKSYGSEGSLHQHLKLKHPQLHIIIQGGLYAEFIAVVV